MSASLISSTLAPTECRIHRPSKVHNKPEPVKFIVLLSFFFLGWYNSSYKQKKNTAIKALCTIYSKALNMAIHTYIILFK